jgi:hypothetical protein
VRSAADIFAASAVSLSLLTESYVFLPVFIVSQHLLQSSSLWIMLPNFKALFK